MSKSTEDKTISSYKFIKPYVNKFILGLPSILPTDTGDGHAS